MIKAPLLARVLKFVITLVPERKVLLRLRGSILVVIPFTFPDLIGWGKGDIRIVEIPRHSIRDKKVHLSVIVKISQLGCPGPVRTRYSREARTLNIAAHSNAYVEAVPHDLPGHGFLNHVSHRAHLTHGHLGFIVCGCSHIESHEIQLTIVVNIPRISSHGKPRCVIYYRGNRIGKSSVTIISEQIIRVRKIVAHIKIHQAIVVVIPPCC